VTPFRSAVAEERHVSLSGCRLESLHCGTHAGILSHSDLEPCAIFADHRIPVAVNAQLEWVSEHRGSRYVESSIAPNSADSYFERHERHGVAIRIHVQIVPNVALEILPSKRQ
jgi:hypothetical protein